ncbi:MAG: IS3 family transposase [Roseobacter sp.]
MKAIDRALAKYPFFGSRQIAAYLRRGGGIIAGRHRVRRLMAKVGLEAIYKRPRASQPHPQHKVYPYLLRGMTIGRPNQVWCSDITFIPVKHGFLYLVEIMDWATQKVLSWRLSNSETLSAIGSRTMGECTPTSSLKPSTRPSPGSDRPR